MVAVASDGLAAAIAPHQGKQAHSMAPAADQRQNQGMHSARNRQPIPLTPARVRDEPSPHATPIAKPHGRPLTAKLVLVDKPPADHPG